MSSRSFDRVRLTSTPASLRSVSIFFALNRLMPAASSKISRRSFVDACSSASTRPWAMMRVAAVPGPAAEEQVLDVLEPGDLAVDEVLAGAVAVDAAGESALRRRRRRAAGGRCRT